MMRFFISPTWAFSDSWLARELCKLLGRVRVPYGPLKPQKETPGTPPGEVSVGNERMISFNQGHWLQLYVIVECRRFIYYNPRLRYILDLYCNYGGGSSSIYEYVGL